MPDKSKFSDPGTDEGMGLPSRMIVFALATLGVFACIGGVFVRSSHAACATRRRRQSH
jgi:hypothetical protein